MRNLLRSLSQPQDLNLETGSGLPYWIFWMLILVIALLLVFIFLRDKDLRRRLDRFFLGIKNRLRRLRLQTTLKKEKQRHEVFMFELGQKAWEEDVEVPSARTLRDELARLDKQRAELEDKRGDLEDRIGQVQQDLSDFEKKQEAAQLKLEAELKPYVDRLNEIKAQEKGVDREMAQKKGEVEHSGKEVEAARKQLQSIEDKGDVLEEVKNFELESLKDKIQNLQAQQGEAAQAMEELKKRKLELEKDLGEQEKAQEEFQSKLKKNRDFSKNETRRFQKDIKEWEKQRDKVVDSIREIDQKKKPLLRELGEQVDQDRVDHEDLEILYSKIDRTKIKTQELEEQIKDLEE
jgi:chromosome segregation ATPase